jgi:hypothetical protein
MRGVMPAVVAAVVAAVEVVGVVVGRAMVTGTGWAPHGPNATQTAMALRHTGSRAARS